MRLSGGGLGGVNGRLESWKADESVGLRLRFLT